MRLEEFFARTASRQAGVELVDVRTAWEMEPTLCVLSSGSGMLMAVLDHLAAEYPYAGLLGADLPGTLSLERRAAVVDYCALAWPTLWVVWASLRDPSPWLDHVHFRRTHRPAGFPLPRLWLYHQGLAADQWAPGRVVHDQADAGMVRVDDLWGAQPLGALDEPGDL